MAAQLSADGYTKVAKSHFEVTRFEIDTRDRIEQYAKSHAIMQQRRPHRREQAKRRAGDDHGVDSGGDSEMGANQI